MDKSLVDRAQKYLFASVEEMEQASLTSVMRARIIRLREMYTYWLQNPRLVDKDIVDQLQQRHQIGLSQAYEDVRVLKVCLGNLGRLTKDYDRYLFRLRCEEGWAMAREQGDVKAFAAVTATYLKGTQLDKEDTAAPDYSVIAPQTFTITADPTAAGFQPVPGILEKAKKLEARYLQEIEPEEQHEEQHEEQP